MSVETPSVLALDGTNLLYRSHFALARSDLRHAGRPVWAVHGLLTSVARLVTSVQPTRILVAFDSPGGCPERRALQPSYKATRSAPEQDLAYQLEWAPRLLTDLGLGSWSFPGWEADDGVASAAASATRESWKTIVVSGDRDVWQLASPLVTVLMPDGSVVTDDSVRAKYGVGLDRYADLAALRGEPGDNLPGVPGVGAKTAAKLLQAFGSLEGVLAAPPEELSGVVSARVAQSLRDHAATARLTFDVAVLRTHLDVASSWTDLASLSPKEVARACDASGLPGAGSSLARALGSLA